MTAFDDFDDAGLGETADERRAYDRETKGELMKALGSRQSTGGAQKDSQEAEAILAAGPVRRGAAPTAAAQRSNPVRLAPPEVIALDSDSPEHPPAPSSRDQAALQPHQLLDWKPMDKVAKEYEAWRKTAGLAAPVPVTTTTDGTKKSKGKARASTTPSIVVKSRLLDGLKVCVVMSVNATAALKTRWKIIHEHSGVLLLRYDPSLTHIICDRDTDTKTFKRFLGIADESEIHDAIKVVQWKWVEMCIVTKRTVPEQHYWYLVPKPAKPPSVSETTLERKTSDEERRRAALAIGSKKAKTRYEPTDSDTSQSAPNRLVLVALPDLEPPLEPTAAAIAGPSSPTIGAPAAASNRERWMLKEGEVADALDEIISGVVAGTIKEADDGQMIVADDRFSLGGSSSHAGSPSKQNFSWSDRITTDGSESEDDHEAAAAKRRRLEREAKEARMRMMDGPYRCQYAHDGTSKGPNEALAVAIEKLGELYRGAPGMNEFRVRGYSKAASIIRNCPVPITSREQALGMKGIGESVADRIAEFLRDGVTKREAFEDTGQSRTINTFTKVYGIGKSKATDLWLAGARTLDDLRDPKYGLSSGQLVGLQYFDDLNSRIPRAEVRQLFDLIEREAKSIDAKLVIDPMGSYRRGEETSGDLDIWLSRDPSDGFTHAGVIRKIVAALVAKGVLVHTLSEPHDWNALESKWMGTGRLSPTGKLRRIDILAIPFDQYGAALLYFTGNEHFNRSIRLYANKNGYSLNQRGLFAGVARDRDRKKTNDGVCVASRTEQDIFDVLGIRWRPPHLRRP